MRLSHFETLKPVCPVCKLNHDFMAPLALIQIASEKNAVILEGLLQCANKHCRQIYPIIDGIPILVHNLSEYLKNNFIQITTRQDYSPAIETLLGDASGAGSPYNNTRHHISSYGWDHYGDMAPAGEFDMTNEKVLPGEITRCLNAGLSLLPSNPEGPMLDIGCALGRSTFELAKKYPSLSLGVDINFWKLRVAQQILLEGKISYPLKQLGIAFERHEYPVSFNENEQVDFWACNAMNLPFANDTFPFISALNVVDVLPVPGSLISNIQNTLSLNGNCILSTPYDWSPPVPIENWIGGHGIRTQEQDSEVQLRSLLTKSRSDSAARLEILGEIEHHTWNIRVHKRRVASYDTHIIACQKVTR